MLVLTRKQNERIQIGDNVSITVTRIKGNTIQLGIEAPKQVKVLRGELLDKQVELDKQADVAGQQAEDVGFAWPASPRQTPPELEASPGPLAGYCAGHPRVLPRVMA